MEEIEYGMGGGVEGNEMEGVGWVELMGKGEKVLMRG